MGEKILADLFLVVAEAVLSYTLDKLDPANKVRDWLKRDPAKLAFQKALARSYAAFARHYPDYVASLFDESFLTKEATPEISKLLIRNQHPDPAALAQLWGQSLGANADFAKRATKPASDFLTWLDAELKGEQVFQPLYDSRALDGIEAGIENLTLELRRSLDAALKNAGQYMDLNVGGDIANSVITTGNYNQVNVNHYYSGNFVSLKDFYEAPDAVFKRVRVEEFIGRAWLTTKVKEFLHDPKRKSGAFLIEGEAGVGKSAFMAHLVHTESYLHLFGEQFSGDTRVQGALLSLGAQLVARYRLTDYDKREDLIYMAGASPQFLQRLLNSASQKLSAGEKIVIVCDALDEAGNFPDGNVFGLPDVLPDGVYFILSQRPVPTKLPNIVADTLTLNAQSDENLHDMEAFLRAATKRNEVATQLRAKNISEETFIRTMKEKSLGVWIYLYYVLDVQNGYLTPLDLDSMPVGLAGYYSKYWGDWRDGKRGDGKKNWSSLYAPLLTTLATAQEAITEEQLRIWANVQATKLEVTRLLREDWRAFITEREDADGICLYRPYHLSFRDFLTGKMTGSLPKAQAEFARELADMTMDAHKRIVAEYRKQCNGKWEDLAPQTYPRRHLSTHLALAKDFQTLRTLLTEGDEHIAWAEEKYKIEETYAGFLADLQPLWKHAENTKDYALGIRLMLIENSIRSLAANIPPLLLAELAKTGMWSIPRCFGVIRQNSNISSQIKMMKLLAPLLNHEQMRELLGIALEIQNESARVYALTDLAPHLNDELKPQALQDALTAAHEIKDESARASALSALAPHLNDELKPQALTAARAIKAEYDRARTLSALAPHLNDELKPQALQDALTAAHEIKDESARASALSALAPHLNDELKPQALQDALTTAREIKAESARARALYDLLKNIGNIEKVGVLEELLFIDSPLRPASKTVELWKEIEYQRLDLHLFSFIDRTSKQNRQKGMDALGALAPALVHFSGGRIIGELLRAIQDTVRWWP
jgi:hypothetical protein